MEELTEVNKKTEVITRYLAFEIVLHLYQKPYMLIISNTTCMDISFTKNIKSLSTKKV